MWEKDGRVVVDVLHGDGHRGGGGLGRRAVVHCHHQKGQAGVSLPVQALLQLDDA